MYASGFSHVTQTHGTTPDGASRSDQQRLPGNEFPLLPRHRIGEPQHTRHQLQRLAEIVVPARLDAWIEIIAHDGQPQRIHVDAQLMGFAGMGA